MNIQANKPCCGCSGCEKICPRSAISMQNDELGYPRPIISKSKCIHCELCEKVCAFNSPRPKADCKQIVYAARHRDVREVQKSRSGAVFVELARKIIKDGGVVYGAAFDKEFCVRHVRVTSESALEELRGSKYVQSLIDECFDKIAEDLKSEISVLFSGTPCQVDAIKSYMATKRIPTARLLLVDIVCHGVPSPKLWHEYLTYLEKEYASKVSSFCFRDKEKHGWSSHVERITFENNKVRYSVVWANLYNKGFLIRQECSDCPYTNLQRSSDITLGDFWGWERTRSTINKDDKGISLVLVNSIKGQELFSAVKDKFIVIESDSSSCLQYNLKSSTQLNPRIGRFVEDFEQYGFKYIVRKYSETSFIHRVLRFIKRLS